MTTVTYNVPRLCDRQAHRSIRIQLAFNPLVPPSSFLFPVECNAL